jgi:hypothetical protein
MQIAAEIWIAAIYGALLLLAGIGRYLTRPKQPVSVDPVLSGVMGGFVDREQMAQLIAAVNRVADVLSDKNAADLNDRLDDIMDRLDGKKPPPRRA